MEVQNKVGIISVYDSAFAHLPRTTIEHKRIYKKSKEFPYPKSKIYSKHIQYKLFCRHIEFSVTDALVVS